MGIGSPRTIAVSGGQALIRRLLRDMLVISLATATAAGSARAAPRAQVVQAPPVQGQPAPGARSPAPAPAPTVIDAAERALIEGRFEDVEALAAEVDAPPNRKVFAALADAARGRYEAALATLGAEAQADPGGEASVEIGFLLRKLGRPEESLTHWRTVLTAGGRERTASSLVRQARVLGETGQPRRANALLQEATALAPDDPRIPTAWARLFLDRHNAKEAAELFEAATRLDARWVPAHLGLAEALADDNPGAARSSLERALAIDGRSLEGRLMLAGLALDERRFDEARAEIDRALEVNPTSVDALALLAGLAYVDDRRDEADQIVARALAVNPKAGEVYRVMGAQAAAHYRFEEAVALVRKGVELDSENPRIQAELGMHLLRTGDEAAARTALERAFKRDPYDVITYNLLALLDTLDRFQTITEGPVVLKLHPDEVAVMRESVLSVAREAFEELGTRFGEPLRGPVLIEMFPRHDDFAVRTLGLPGMIGALGACFGRVVTLDSPRARQPPGNFNWAATLWHELAHVAALQLSAQRVPRWLTEGASVYEERRANPAWGREGEYEFLKAYAKDELIPVATLNTGFSNARTITLAYHEASLVVEHLVERFGDAGLQRLLRAFATGASQEEALQTALGLSFESLQTSFDQFLAARFAAARTALVSVDEPLPSAEGPDAAAALTAFADKHAGNYGVQIAAGRALVAAGALRDARRVLERAASLVPQTMGDESARVGLAELAEKQGERATAMTELERVLASSHTGMETARRLLALARDAGDERRSRVASERIVALDPFDGTAHAELGRLALARSDAPEAVRSLELALSLKPKDPAASHTDLAEAYLLAGQSDGARRHAIAALEIAPRFERAQELLLKIVDGR